MPTPPDPQTTAENLAARIRHLMQTHPHMIFEGIGISLPGRFDQKTKRVVFAPNLKWPEFDFKAAIEKATGMRVDLENAANACVLAEVAPPYATPVTEPELYIRYLVTDRGRSGSGIGAELIADAIEETRRRGIGLLRVDCYAGDDRRLPA